MNDAAYDPRPQFHAIAAYKLYGETTNGGSLDGRLWTMDRLDQACDDNIIDFGTVLLAEEGQWGLQYVVFEVDLRADMQVSVKLLKKKIRRRLNKIVNDSDVEVLWISKR